MTDEIATTFESRTDVGGYPIVYISDQYDSFCPRCAQKEYETNGTPLVPFIHPEGEPIECDACGERGEEWRDVPEYDYQIESAYGEPE